MATKRNLTAILRDLRDRHGAPTATESPDPFPLVLWEQVAYLVDDTRRARAFELLETRVGLTPGEILAAPLEVLVEIAASGGKTAAATRAERMQESARRVMTEWDGDLRRALALEVGPATRALAKFPMIGRPGAEKILLLTRAHRVLALESNGLRVLVRLGYGTETDRYEKTHASVRAATENEAPADIEEVVSLHLLLRLHGRTVCRRSEPECGRCPLTRRCAYHREQRT